MHSDAGRPPIYPDGQLVHLGRCMEGTASTAWTVNEFPDLLIRYTAWCKDSRSGGGSLTDPTLRIFFFQRLLSRVNLAPVIHYMSPPFVPSKAAPWKDSFRKLALLACPEGAPVRMVVMERLGVSLTGLVETVGIFSLRDAASMLVAVVRLLEKVHKWFGIVHGDINPGNIVLEHRDVGTVAEALASPLKLIDFEMSFIKGNEPILDEGLLAVDRHRVLFMKTPWEMLAGATYSFRDEVYRVVQLLPHLLFGPVFFLTLRSAFEQPNKYPVDTLVAMKRKGDIFELSAIFPQAETNPFDLGLLFPDHKDGPTLARAKLKQLMQLILGMGVSERPNYSLIVHLLTELMYI